MQLAIALYNNNVDDEEELEFRKGDLLTVLIENPHGLDGWWLCQHRGKCGLCPGNRLKLLPASNATARDSADFVRFPSHLSTASMYDGLAVNHDYDNTQSIDVSPNSITARGLNCSAESSSRSSGISSTIDLQSSSSSTEFHTSNLIKADNTSNDRQQLKRAFEKLSIRSDLLTSYNQIISKPTLQSNVRSFTRECRTFLRDYGYLLDRYTYKTIKEHLLNDLEQAIDNATEQILHFSTQIIQFIQPIIELRLKQKCHLQPINELSNGKMTSSSSAAQIYGHLAPTSSRPQLPTSKTYHSNLFANSSLVEFHHENHTLDPLMKCYHRHIRDHVDAILKRYSTFNKNEQRIASIIADGKTLAVAGHKLVFVLETLHEHLQQRQTPLSLLTRQLTQALTILLQLLKQLTQQNSIASNHQNILHFKQHTKTIMNLVKRIKLQCH